MRKPLRILKNQLINAILMVALTVPLLMVAVSLDQKPTLSFEGARIQLVQDANGELSAQLLFDVCVTNVEYTGGVQFELHFNPDYLEPSDYVTNEPLGELWETVYTDREFKANPELYKDGDGVSVNPFMEPPKDHACIVSKSFNTNFSSLYMYLAIDDGLVVDPAVNDLMVSLPAGMEGNSQMNVLKADKKLVLGTLSFRVVDLDTLPIITRKFDRLENVVLEANHAKDDADDMLICFMYRAESPSEENATPWGIAYPQGTERDRKKVYYNDYDNDRAARATFTYLLPKTIIKARAAEAELTINAYQAYTRGDVSDIDQALQRYSPAITVTYSDGSEGNFIMPWSRDDTVDGLDWTETVVYDWGTENWRDDNGNLKDNWKDSLSSKKRVVTHPDPVDNVNQTQYDPTASGYKPDNQRYLVQKDFCYKEIDFDGVERNKVFPLPIDVRLTVTPITLIDVTANDLARSYVLNDALVDGLTAVQSLSALKLPSQARLITDVPAGGVTLTMDIPGWSHPQTYTDGGSPVTKYWPSDKDMGGTGETVADLWNDRATNETEGGYLHWPTDSDKGKWAQTETGNGAYLGANRAGVYTFQMAEGYGGAPKYFTRLEIQTAYPWLTVPEDSKKVDGHPEAWPIDDATRTIVWNGDPSKPEDEPKLEDIESYVVEYRSTLDGANDQPELTLRVHKIEIGHPDNYDDLPNASIFRIKLPDGTEMAVGYTESGEGVDQSGNWFANNDGHYEGKAVEKQGYHQDKRVFDLISNPGEPTESINTALPGYGDEREKLRRYINLGGWFYVSVKERESTSTDNGDGTTTTTITDQTTWSDFMPVYVPPRDNYYTESKVYNFIGDNAGLYPWAGGLSTTVILPPGTYTPVAFDGTTIRPDYVSGTTRKVERYSLTTTYDGATGAQPGYLNTFTIDPTPDPAPNNDWQRTGPVSATNQTDGSARSVTTYGPEFFKDSVLYNAYGKVLNRMTDRAFLPVNYLSNAETATIRLEEDNLETAHAVEKIVLEYVATHGGERSVDYDDTNGYDSEFRERYNVSNVIFETKTEGYTARQDYVLRIKNVGDVDIHGLSIDTLTDLVGNNIYDKDLDSNPAGGHFEILKPPASFLPVGESTTFVLTYVYDLRAKSNAPMNYRDKLFITSNSKHTVGVDAYNKYHDPLTTDGEKPYLLDFDAQFQVTNSDIYRVFVRYIPADGCMGTAGVIIGLEDPGDLTSMNTAAGPTAYTEGDWVYILISPTDEYTKVDAWAVNTSIPTQMVSDFYPYTGAGTTGNLPGGDTRIVYSFKMPAHDTTVTVVFNEPTRSKLRLSDLRVYRDLDHSTEDDPECLYPFNTDWNDPDSLKYKAAYEELPIWQKSFTAAEQTAAATYTQEDYEKQYLMTKGVADKPGSRPNFVDTVEQYLVVLPFEADIAQVEVDLRKVLYLFDTANGDPIDNKALTGIVVQMTLFDSKDMILQPQAPGPIFSNAGTDIYPSNWPSTGRDWPWPTSPNWPNGPYVGYKTGQTNDPSTHTSLPFPSPEPGSSKYVKIELSYTEGTTTERRAYYLEIHRAAEEVEAELHYGNSPYGMIMNATNITAGNKSRAKAAFIDNNYTFSGMSDSLTPKAVTEGGLTNLHYWLEAWAEPTEKWTAPNADWSTTNNYDPDPTASPDPAGVYDADTGMGWELYNSVHQANVNLDLNDYAFFAIMGEEFKDPGLVWARDSSGRPVDLTDAILSLSVYTLNNGTGVDKDVPGDQWTRFALPDPSVTGVPSGDDTADVKARTVTFGFVDKDNNVPAASGDTVTANWATWYITGDKLTQTAEVGSTPVELRPGRYRLAYTFPDYNYVAGDPDYENNFLTVYRDFVVLAPVGDVNADLATITVAGGTAYTTDVDETLVEGRISPNFGYPALGYMADNYNYSAIFKLRTCDVNNDRNINNIDANTILRNTGVKRFYLPVDYIK